ncbi:MAG TPA: VOC family protein [Candidatus Nanoarchaeia archaeon]|nr:VOC family protein [Candidatus Nanoarchaeia archaeon]
MAVKEIAFVAYPVIDWKKSRYFYEEILGMKPSQEFMNGDVGGVEYTFGEKGEYTFSIGKGFPGFEASGKGVVATLEVDNFDELVEKFKENNVEVYMPAQDHRTCKSLGVIDPAGNQLMIHQKK